ncbi:MAG: Glycosyl transferases group 1 [Betaproteobacteria bacterium ADurb.Bin341]|nr:MAG: Glycosyl transferases group 1 [Betaproteobacteria bacterium ADurb.Bin341]
MTDNSQDWIVSIKSFRRKREMLHAWGTLYGSGEIPCAAWLKSDLSSLGAEQGVRAILSKAIREEKESSIDFVFYGTHKNIGQPPATPYLLLEWQDGRQQFIPLPSPRQVDVGRGINHILALPWAHYFSRGWRLVRQRQTGLLIRKLTSMTATLFTSGWHPMRLLKWASAEGKPLAIVIDHDLGGGANLYRQSHIAHLMAKGFTPLLFSAHHGILSYVLTAMRGKRRRTAYIDDPLVLFKHLSHANIQRIIFNNILSFHAPLALVKVLTNWLQEHQTVHFLFLVHDYYCICPIWLLLDHTGKHCGIPDMNVCGTCMRSNNSPFLEFSAGISIVGWRSIWGGLLQQADEIRCFSNSSRILLLRAHPSLDQAKISVVPHSLDRLRLRKIDVQDCGYPVIGIIGHITAHKGAHIVQDLAYHIKAGRKKARIVVIGTIDLELPTSVVTIIGPYRLEELPNLLELHQVNIGLFPSICPETFSYVTEEMMAMGLPVLTFNIGAPGERVALYPLGRVIPFSKTENLMQEIITLYNSHVRRK